MKYIITTILITGIGTKKKGDLYRSSIKSSTNIARSIDFNIYTYLTNPWIVHDSKIY